MGNSISPPRWRCPDARRYFATRALRVPYDFGNELVLADGAELLSRCIWRGVCFPFFELVEQTRDFGVYRAAIGDCQALPQVLSPIL